MPHKLNPDIPNKLQGYMASGMMFFGQPVTLRKYISASAGNPDLGISDRLCYQNRPAQMELRTLTLEELQMIGGQDIHGTLQFVSVVPVDMRDEVVYNKETYRVISQPQPEVIGQTLYWDGFMARASITGYFA